MRRFMRHLLFSILLAKTFSSYAVAVEGTPIPDADYGRIKLHEPLPDRASIYANWLHDRENGFRILVPPMSTVHCLKSPLQEGASIILLRILPFEMEVVEIGMIPASINEHVFTSEQILDAIPADEKTDIFNKKSTVGTQWKGRCFRTLGEDAPPPLTTMITRKSEDHFLFARFRSLTQLEIRTALTIIDSISFVEKDFQLENVLSMREFQESKNEFVPHRTMRAWFENDRANGLVTHEDEQGRRVFTLTWLNGRQSGLEFLHWPSGAIYCLKLFENDIAQGQRVTFYESGELNTMMDVQNGVGEGTYGVYYRNGTISIINRMTNGQPHGERLHYLPDGRLIGRTVFDHGEEMNKEVVLEITRSEYESTLESNPAPHSVWKVAR